ncbi:hypothetical protein MASR1M66_01900 [Aminivibrio sp.]
MDSALSDWADLLYKIPAPWEPALQRAFAGMIPEWDILAAERPLFSQKKTRIFIS